MLTKLRRYRWFLLGRLKIRKGIAHAAAKGKVKVVLGAYDTNYEGWISTDLPHFDILKRADWQYLFRQNKADNLLAEHVFEHLTEEQAKQTLHHCNEWLKTGGCIRIAVPDAFHADPGYLRNILPPVDGHLTAWNVEKLSALLMQCGFAARPLEYFTKEKQLITPGFDEGNGHITRSIQKGFVNNIPGYSSLIIDATKTNAPSPE